MTSSQVSTLHYTLAAAVVVPLVFGFWAVAGPSISDHADGLKASVQAAFLTESVNSERVGAGAAPLREHPLLTRAAQVKADDMARRGYFSHTDPEGQAAWTLLEQSGYPYRRVGENLALNFASESELVLAWMESSTHRANLLLHTFSEVGTGVATGTYLGVPVEFVVQLYAQPR